MSSYGRWIGSLTASAVFLTAVPAVAQPAISNLSGIVSNNQTITITGSSFGTKPSAAPLVWEDFNDGALPSSLVTHGSTSFTSNTDNLRHPFSGRNARSDYKAGGYYFGYEGSQAPKWFVQYWIKLSSNWHWGTSTYSGADDGLANIKMFRMFPNGSRTYANVGYQIHGFAGGGVHRFVENGASGYFGADAWDLFSLGTWHNVQVQYGENSGVDQNNGTIKLWIDGVPLDNTTNLNTNPGGDGSYTDKRPYIIGFYDSWNPSDASVSNMYAYYGDIYIDNTWARVEIGNAPSYNGCTHRETLVPTAWSANSVSARVNQGSFTTGQAAYIYVTDATGRVNANGFTSIIGGGAVTPPSAPTNLRVVR